MAIEVRAVSTDPKTAHKLTVDGKTIERMMGDKEDAVAVQISELLSAVRTAVSGSVTEESELSIEISGDVTIKGEGGVKWLFFNVGGSAETKNTMKVTLKTKIPSK